MKTFNILVLIAVFAGLISCNTTNQFLEEIDKVRVEFAPDSRTSVFDVTVVDKGDGIILKGETTEKEAKKELLAYFKDQNINVVDSLHLLSEGSDHPWAIVTISVANLRDEKKFSAQLVSQLILGTPVRILKKKGDWVLVQGPDKYIGWMTTSSIYEMNNQKFEQWKQSKRVMVLVDTWLVDDRGNHISDLVKGSIVQKNIKEAGKYDLPDQRSGYLQDAKIKRLENYRMKDGLDADSLCYTAFNFLGLPYLWGGTSSKAVDCSGFMKNIYFLNGYILARDASQQIMHGLKLPLVIDSLKKGDLLFFGRKNPVKVTHVAMYIGDSHYIHASGRVKINSLSPEDLDFSAARLSSWVGAVRYVQQPAQEGLQPVVSDDWYFSK